MRILLIIACFFVVAATTGVWVVAISSIRDARHTGRGNRLFRPLPEPWTPKEEPK